MSKSILSAGASLIASTFATTPLAHTIGFDTDTVGSAPAGWLTGVTGSGVAKWTVEADAFQSASRNTPFDGWKLKGRAVRTIVRGKTVWQL